MNMYSSLVKEERRRANQSRDLCLEISRFNEKMLSETVALTIQDYEKIQKISRRQLKMNCRRLHGLMYGLREIF
jgi:hypothetical protein